METSRLRERRQTGTKHTDTKRETDCAHTHTLTHTHIHTN